MQHDLDVTLDELVKALREKAELTQQELAAQTGVSKGYIARIETGDSSVGVAILTRIADVLGASTSDRRRLSRARDKASERLSTKRSRQPTDIGPRPATAPGDGTRGRDRADQDRAGSPDIEVESLRKEVRDLALAVERLAIESRRRLDGLERQVRQSRRSES